VLYLVTAELFGTHYLIQRLMGVAAVVLASALFFALARRRVGNAIALAPAILLLVYGSAWQHVAGPIGFTVVFSAAAGMGALLALEREDRRGDLIACALLCLAVFTFSVGVGFLVGAAIGVLLSRERVRRAWVFLIPLAGYAAWWFWARQFGQEGRTTLANIDRIPGFFADSASVVSGAITGVNIPFSRFGEAPAPIATAPTSALGWIAAAAFVAAVVWRIARGNVPRSLWVSLGVMSTYWLAVALSDPLFQGEQTDAIRYIYPGTIGVLLVVTDAFRDIRIARRAVAAVWVVAIFSLAMNLVFLRDGASYLRNRYSPPKRENLAMLELANGELPGGSATGKNADPRPELAADIPFLLFGPGRDGYLAAVAKYGSPAYDLSEIRALGPGLRANADLSLTQAYSLAVVPGAGAPAGAGCRRAQGEVRLPAGGALLKGNPGTTLSLRRFGDAPGSVLGPLPDGWAKLTIPSDPAPDPWYASVPAGERLEVCPIPG
jgi:hypothetical protein